MKIELIKETRIDGVWYSVEKDGRYVDSTVSRDEAETKAKYEFIVESKGELILKEVIESTEL